MVISCPDTAARRMSALRFLGHRHSRPSRLCGLPANTSSLSPGILGITAWSRIALFFGGRRCCFFATANHPHALLRPWASQMAVGCLVRPAREPPDVPAESGHGPRVAAFASTCNKLALRTLHRACAMALPPPLVSASMAAGCRPRGHKTNRFASVFEPGPLRFVAIDRTAAATAQVRRLQALLDRREPGWSIPLGLDAGLQRELADALYFHRFSSLSPRNSHPRTSSTCTTDDNRKQWDRRPSVPALLERLPPFHRSVRRPRRTAGCL